MKKLISLLIIAFCTTSLFGQNAYIQVYGEPNLSVFLNNQFKGKTTAELKGYIIENVTPGSNLIKIVKEGYTPFEETITVKAGEVFAYKVKPFAKHVVTISENGNTGETDKKVAIETGKLIVQSVPIEITITMPAIEGVNKTPKTKDEWIADKIPAGTYSITFMFNQKTITKSVEIGGDGTTSVFVNMLTGEYKAKNSLDEKKAAQKEMEKEETRVVKFVDSVMAEYKFKPWIQESEFRILNPIASSMMTDRHQVVYSQSKEYHYWLRDFKPQFPSYISFNPKKQITGYCYQIIFGKKNYTEAAAYFENLLKRVNSAVLVYDWNKSSTSINIDCPRRKVKIDYTLKYDEYWKTTSVSIFFFSKE